MPKPLVFVVISVLVVAFIYGSFTPFIVFAVPYGQIDCRQTGTLVVTCCQDHLEKTSTGIGFEIVTYCTECQVGRGGVTGPAGHLHSCSERYIDVSAVEPTPTPTPTPPPTGALTPGNVQNLPTLEQVPTPTPPPLFGETPGGGAEQPSTLTPTQPTPDTGDSTTQPGTPQTVTPEITQDDNQGGGLPSIQGRDDLPSDNEITEQPDTEDDGQEDAGPLT